MVIPVIGVDFGDCTTIMSFIDEYDPVNRMSGVVHNLVPLRFWDGIPNVYYYSRKVGKTLCGQEAISSKAKPEQNRLRNLRRHLGEKIQIDDRIIFYDDAITEVIEHCIRVANKCLEAGWHVSTNLVSLSYPATYTFAQRQRLIELVEKATLEDGRNIKVVGTIADPAAAALDYLAEFANKDIDTTTVLTYDLGGGTFDLGLVSVYPKGRKGRDGNTYYYDIINTSGIPDLGGAEFDEVMFQLVSSKINVSLDPQMKAILKNASETAKVELSDMTDTQIQIFTANGPLDISITRTEFERVVMPLVQKTIDETRRMLNNHANQKPYIILLTGGASQMPIIMREMEKAFPDYKGRIKIHKPSMSTAYGTARYGVYKYENSAAIKEVYNPIRIINNLGDIRQVGFYGIAPYKSSVTMLSGDSICIQEYDRELSSWKNIISCSINISIRVRIDIAIISNGVLDVKINEFCNNKCIQIISTMLSGLK